MILRDFTRWIWLSEAARATWSMRISAVSRAWAQVEAHSVLAGVRSSLLVFPTIEKLTTAFREAAEHGLLLMPMALEGATDSYAATSADYKPGMDGKFRCVITRPELAGQWLMAYQDSDEITIGKLLGYPDCCTEFYRRVWVREKQIDTTEQMANDGADGPLEANILLRWLGVRLVPHLPCSFNCQRTIALARELYPVWSQLDFDRELEWAKEMLSWPVEWNARHGVAEIRTPILTIMTRTNWTPDTRIVQRKGSSYPAEGAQGLKFPYRIVKDKATGVPSFKRSMTPVWELNGFGSAESMESAHGAVLKALKQAPRVGTLLDLGCGTGRLLEWAQARGWQVSGVESDPVRAGAAQVSVRRGDMFNTQLWSGPYDVVAVMPGRLLEYTADRWSFLSMLRERATHVLLYAYGDWLKDGGLPELAAKAGFGTHEVNVVRAPGVEAMIIDAANIPDAIAAPT